VVEHRLHLVAVVDLLVHIRGQHGGHEEVYFGQGVLQDGGLFHILQHGPPALARAMIEDVETVRPAAKVGVVAPGAHGHLAISVAEGHARRSRFERPAHQVLRQPDADAVCFAAALDENLPGALVVHFDADALQHFEAAGVNPLALRRPHARVVSAGLTQSVCLNHGCPIPGGEFCYIFELR